MTSFRERWPLRRIALRAWVLCWLVLVWIFLWGTFSAANVLSGLAIALVITVLLPLPAVPVETAIALGNLKRRGLAVAVVLVMMDDTALEQAYARLIPEGIRDLRHLRDEATLPYLCGNQVQRAAFYDFANLGG